MITDPHTDTNVDPDIDADTEINVDHKAAIDTQRLLACLQELEPHIELAVQVDRINRQDDALAGHELAALYAIRHMEQTYTDTLYDETAERYVVSHLEALQAAGAAFDMTQAIEVAAAVFAVVQIEQLLVMERLSGLMM